MSPDSPAQLKSALDALPRKRQAFVRAFVTGDDGSGHNRFVGTAAARSAGYAKPESESTRLLKIAEVQAAISELLTEYTLSPGETLMLLREDAVRSDDDVIRVAARAAEDAGVPAGASMVSALISSRTTARTNLAKHHGLLTDKVQFEGEFPVLRILRMGDEN